MILDAPNRDDDYSDDDEGYVDDGLTKRQRSVVEFFIAKLRLRSQKTMRYWALVPPRLLDIVVAILITHRTIRCTVLGAG
jgi:hypothetical protein